MFHLLCLNVALVCFIAMKLLTSIILLCLVKIVYASNGPSKYYTKLRSVACHGNPDLLRNITCKLKPINWEKSTVSMESDLVGVIRNASLRFELFKFTNQFRPFLLNRTVNLCEMLKTGQGNIYGKVVLRLFSRFSNINHSCPYWGHLTLQDFYFDPSFVPFVIPSARYKAVISFYEGYPFVHIGTVELIACVSENHLPPRTKPQVEGKKDIGRNIRSSKFVKKY